MKKVTIGRGHECDVVVNDVTDVVSRRQAVITFTFMGKMTIYDLSTNGTYVNGERIPKPSGVPLKRSDKVNFGSVFEFDLARVPDPYRKLKTFLIIGIVAVVIAIGCIIGFTRYYSSTTPVEPVPIDSPTVITPAAPAPEAPVVTPTEPAPAAPAAKKADNKSSRKSSDTPIARKRSNGYGGDSIATFSEDDFDDLPVVETPVDKN